MIHILVGALMMAGLLLLVDFTRRKGLGVVWWQWLLTALAFAYATFVIEVMISFVAEGSPKAALVMGIGLGLVAVVWGVLLSRFIFAGDVSQSADHADGRTEAEVEVEEEPSVNE